MDEKGNCTCREEGKVIDAKAGRWHEGLPGEIVVRTWRCVECNGIVTIEQKGGS